MSIKHLYPTSTPSLNLNFKSSGVADPRLSCVRNSIGTYVDPASGLVKTAPDNVARVEKGGLLVEETSTNAITQTVDFTAGSWSTVGSGIAITVNNSTAPDGTTTANKINRDGTSSQAYLSSGITTNTGTWTHSCFFKQGTHAIVQIAQSGESWSYANFDLSDGSLGNVGNASFVSSSIEEYANGWYRCTVKVIMNSGGAPKPSIALVPSKTSTFIPTTTTNGYVYAWGLNSVNQDRLTSYIPASGSTVQRLRDQIDVGIDNWWNDTEGTIVLEADYSQTSNTMTLYSADLGSGIKHRLLQEGASIRYTMRNTGGSTVFNFSQTASPEKTAFGYATDNLRFAYDNALSPLDTSGTPPTGILYFRIGRDNNNSNPLLAGHIKRLTFYSTRASDTALQSLTL